jgi:hypothetical protein
MGKRECWFGNTKDNTEDGVRSYEVKNRESDAGGMPPTEGPNMGHGASAGGKAVTEMLGRPKRERGAEKVVGGITKAIGRRAVIS